MIKKINKGPKSVINFKNDLFTIYETNIFLNFNNLDIDFVKKITNY